MANARREVDLVVKAKDDAAKVVDAITAAINGLVEAQTKAVQSTGKLGGGVGGLVKAVSGLNTVLKGGSGADRLASDLDKATKAVAGLKTQLDGTEGELASLKQQTEAAAGATSKLKNEVNALEKELAQQSTATKAAAAAHGKLKGEMASQEATVRKLTRTQTALTGQIERQKGRIGETADKFQQLGAQIEQAEAPSKRLQQSFTQTEAKLAKQTEKLAALEARLKQTGADLTEAGAAAKEFGDRVAASAAGLEKQRTAIVNTRTSLSELKSQAREAAAGERDLEASVERVTAELDRQKGSLAGAEKSYEALGAATDKAKQGMAELAAAARGPLAQAIAAQRGVVSGISQEFQKVRGELAQVNAAMKGAGINTTGEMVAEYNKLRTALREIETEFSKQRTVFAEMRGAYNGLSADTAQLSAVTQRFDQALRESAQSLQLVQAVSGAAAGAMGRIKTESTQAAQAVERVTQEIKETGAATTQAAAKTNALSQAYRQLYGESRQALSYTQRLRGEVLSLISAYGGIFGVIQGLTAVVDATKKVEAAQVRLSALYGGDQLRAAEEFDFIRRNADRLGIDLGELSDEYTKFAAATKGTVIEGEKTRDIFIKVAEAGRVNQLSMADMSGIFRALIQIASKGKVQLEELSGQLGDRLPGALQIMADGLGITVEELLKLTKEGQVSSSALANFADELEKRYGEALPAALEKTSSVIGKFQNALTQALLAFGQGGFIEGFNSLLVSLTKTMQSADFKTFAANVSAAFGVLAKTLGLIAENFQLVAAAAGAFLAIKIAPVVLAAVGALTRFTTVLGGVGAAYTTATVAAKANATGIAASTGVLAGATRAMIGLRAAITGLLASTGVGLLIAGIGAGIAAWVTEADSATEALERHKRIMDTVKNAYDEAKGKVVEWRKEISTLSEVLLRDNVASLQNVVTNLTKERISPFENLDLGSDELNAVGRQVQAITRSFLSGYTPLAKYVETLDALYKEADKEGSILAEVIRQQLETAEADNERVTALKEAKLALDAKTKSEEEGQKALDEVVNKTKEATKSQDEATDSANKYKDALNEIKSFIPGLGDELKKLAELAKLDEAYKEAQKYVKTIEDAINLSQNFTTARNAINNKYAPTPNYINSRGTPTGEEYASIVASTTRLAKEMNLSVEDLLTVIHYESGFRTQIMGGAQGKYFGLFQASPDVRQQYGIGPGSTVEDQIAALGKYLKDRGVQPGDGRLPIYAAINAGNAKAINASDANNGGRPGDVQWKVNNDMEGSERAAKALLEAYGGIKEKAEQTYETETKRAEKLAEMELSQQEQLRIAEVENKFKDADLVTRTTEIELEKARIAAEREGATLSAESEAAIRRRVELSEREKSNQEAITSSKQAAEQAEARFNALVSQRESLMKQAEALRAQGNTTGAQAATQQAAALKAQLDAAAASAIAMWQKIGGPEAQAAIEKIKQASLESQNLTTSGNAVNAMWTQVGQSLGDNLVNAFDEFAQAVANGENAWKALGRALQKAAAQFLIDIGKMIIRQMIFNALSGFFPGLQPGANGLFHDGSGSGTVGENLPNRTRNVDPRVWGRAPRFHRGYQSGIGPKEMPAILEKTEAVMTAESPFHPNNQAKTLGAMAAAGAANGGGGNIRIINAIDSASVLEEALNTPAGERAILNHYRKNKSSFQEVMK